MSARALTTTAAVMITLGGPIVGCLDAPEYYYGESLVDVRFVVWELDMGVHPSRAALDDPNNPFRERPPSAEMKWQLLQYGGDAAAFYAWATLLAIGPTGELQFYTAQLAERVAQNGGVTEVEAPYVRQIALDGYAAVLEHFPESVTFDPTGTIPYRLAPLAYEAIVALGGSPPPGWARVATPDGGTTVIRVDAPADAAAGEEGTP